MRPGPLATLAAVAAALVACSPEAGPAVEVAPAEPPAPVTFPSAAPVIGYACDGGGVASVQYIDAATARLFYRGTPEVLRLAPSPRGARWVGETREWRTIEAAGVEQATLSEIGPDSVATTVIARCHRPVPGRAAAPVTGPSPARSDLPPACRGPQLALSAEGSDAGAGGRSVTLSLRNVGTRVCSLSGYPGVALVDTEGRSLADVRSEPVLGASGQPTETVVLPPRGKAWFDVRWTVVPDETLGPRPCTPATRMRVTAPGDTSPVSLDQSLAPCNGRVRVTALRGGEDPDVAAQAAAMPPAD